jgi:hypothetical protein
VRQPFIKDIEVQSFEFFDTYSAKTLFKFPKNLVDSYEKYPESLVTGLSKIGGILALVRIV